MWYCEYFTKYKRVYNGYKLRWDYKQTIPRRLLSCLADFYFSRQERNLKVNHPVSDQTSGSPSGPVPSTTSHTVPNNRSPKTTPAVDPARGGTVQQQSRRRSDGHTAATPNSPLQQPYSRALARPGFEGHYQSGLDKQRNEMEVELRGMMGKVQEMDKRKHEVELELANKVAELETKVRNVTFLV